jgi:protoporphyrin/coproporphyrin ferrochelatase
MHDDASKGEKTELMNQKDTGKIGVLLINLGTPDATDYWSMRRYLKEFLSDARVVETNRVLWWFILNCIILTTRPGRSGKAYASIWNKELDESPLRTITRGQSDKLKASLADKLPNVIVDWAMRYGTPSIGEKIERLKSQGCDRILLFSLYPQYSAATIATANDKAFDALAKMRWQPAVRTVPSYEADPAYISALVQSMEQSIAGLGWQPDVVLASFHGLPQAYVDKGDPYQHQCEVTTDLMRQKLGWGEDRLKLTFQSRMGRAQWLQPYTDKTIESLARDGVKNIAVITPGFAADCIETLEEIAIEGRDIFLEHGGENFAALPCLNDSAQGIDVLEAVVMRELQGWI